MKKFEELDKRDVYEVETSILDTWKKQGILDRTIENRSSNANWVFYDGPATANGMPGLHHMVGKFLKDSFCKYHTMKGSKVLRKIGWDTHGLPVEVAVEKKLGFTGKADIEKYGIEAFNKLCKETVWDNETAFRKLTEEMGQFIDLDNRYITYDNNYIETEWWILKKFFDEGLFYEGVKIVPWCPRCGTGLASHEVAQGYKEIDANTVVVPFKKKDEDAYFLVWTTTPWTLISNVALCVNPDEEYAKVESKGYKFILAKSLLNAVLGDEYNILETYKGKDLEFVEYEQLIPSDDIKVNGKAFFVTCDSYVTMTDGTGIVHIAPAFGEDDAKVGKKYKLPYINPVGEDAKYVAGLWKGMNIFDADLVVIDYLKENDKLFKKQKIKHDYPHCWRCDSPLVYYSRPSFYLEVTKLQDKIIEENKKVTWYPSFVGEKRFGNWLENMNDWAISRSRYWGTPLPLWRCSCGHDEMIGSREELREKAIEKIDSDIDLHRPYVDDIHIKCPVCGNTMNRVKDVIDCWFDSGAMPFAQYHYPFENKELWESQYPADFIAEGIDQTRGWFYSLIVIGVFLTGKSPYKNVLVNELLLDKYGQKMHKSRGNAVEPFTIMHKYGADTVRFYLAYVSPTWTPLKFDEEGLKEVHSKFFNPLKNTYSFFQTYANIDNIDIDECKVPYENREEIDKWLISKYNKLVSAVTEAYDAYDLNAVVRALTTFVSEDLSNWYIRRNRNRFWGSDLDNSKKSVYITTYEVLTNICKLMAPVIPYTSEEIFKKLTGKESVHLEDFPVADNNLVDENIENRMDLVRTLISVGRYVREEAKIKVRQPLSEVLIDGKNEELIKDLTDLIKEELNVKKVIFIKDTSLYMNFMVKPNFKIAGPVFGSNIKYFSESLNKLSLDDINRLRNNETIEVLVDGSNYTVSSDMVDIRISSKEGFNVGFENNNFIIINTELTEELILEGIAREIISKVQQLRKAKDFNIVDRIDIYYEADGKVEETFKKYEEYIKNETLAENIIPKKLDTEAVDVNGFGLKFDVINKAL